jgi:hypothetical protein
MDRTIKIDGKDVKFRATALTPRLYRGFFLRDMVRDMNKLRKAYNKAASLGDKATDEEREEAQLSAMDLEIFENAAYIMARHATPDNIAPSPDEWLDGFNMFSIYEILPQLLELWALNEAQTSKPKKK